MTHLYLVIWRAALARCCFSHRGDFILNLEKQIEKKIRNFNPFPIIWYMYKFCLQSVKHFLYYLLLEFTVMNQLLCCSCCSWYFDFSLCHLSAWWDFKIVRRGYFLVTHVSDRVKYDIFQTLIFLMLGPLDWLVSNFSWWYLHRITHTKVMRIKEMIIDSIRSFWFIKRILFSSAQKMYENSIENMDTDIRM